jgi:hypothetical protein
MPQLDSREKMAFAQVPVQGRGRALFSARKAGAARSLSGFDNRAAPINTAALSSPTKTAPTINN